MSTKKTDSEGVAIYERLDLQRRKETFGVLCDVLPRVRTVPRGRQIKREDFSNGKSKGEILQMKRPGRWGVNEIEINRSLDFSTII